MNYIFCQIYVKYNEQLEALFVFVKKYVKIKKGDFRREITFDRDVLEFELVIFTGIYIVRLKVNKEMLLVGKNNI